jgi:hypothetical protein
VHVDPGVDPSQTVVTVDVSGGIGTITVIPKDKYGNDLGPGRGHGFTVTGVPGTTVTSTVKDNRDGSYTVPVNCRKWKILFWIAVAVAVILLLLLLLAAP